MAIRRSIRRLQGALLVGGAKSSGQFWIFTRSKPTRPEWPRKSLPWRLRPRPRTSGLANMSKIRIDCVRSAIIAPHPPTTSATPALDCASGACCTNLAVGRATCTEVAAARALLQQCEDPPVGRRLPMPGQDQHLQTKRWALGSASEALGRHRSGRRWARATPACLDAACREIAPGGLTFETPGGQDMDTCRAPGAMVGLRSRTPGSHP